MAAELAERAAAARSCPDPRGVHRLRVATRRTRSALRTFRDVLPESLDPGVRAELRSLARALGAVRDLDVYRERFAAMRSKLTAEDAAALVRHERYLDTERRRAAAELAAILDEGFAERLEGFAARAADVRAADARAIDAEGKTVRRAARAYIERGKKGVLKHGARIDRHSPSDRLHALRIRIKRFRYLLEFCSPLFEARVEAALPAAIRAQDLLGTYQDACTAVARLRGYAAAAPAKGEFRAEMFALGQIAALERRAARKARNRFAKEWPAIEKAIEAFTIDD
ncbi:MAG TPA: CHAD domain-containing protein [Gammaproteobacteria bacterium]|nr:CHAD domain-containing protein [Gammaproteobacteria bacterium]